jgi:F-box-like
MDILPDDILLEIFDFHSRPKYDLLGHKEDIELWQTLVHVCRRWRNIVFGSPRRLNLRLCCTPGTPARDTLDVWPALPLIINTGAMPFTLGKDNIIGDNIIAALEQSNRVCEIYLRALAGWQLEKVLAAMRVPFPELTVLQLFSDDEPLPVIPGSFLGGSAPPRLRVFRLGRIPFPAIPKLLLDATCLVSLRLSDVPHSAYISPEAMVALISVSPSLEALILEFKSPRSRPDWESRSLPPPKRSILPALKSLGFRGVTEYLEELVTRIDTSRLNSIDITFFNQIDFDCPRLAQFINRTPDLRARDEAIVFFDNSTACIRLGYWTSESDEDELIIYIPCREPDWQLSSIEQICNSSLHPLSIVEDLIIEHDYSKLFWQDDAIENTLWLQLLLPFTAVINLYLFKEFAPGIAAALQELVEGRITEVLPSLENIFVRGLETLGPFQENIGQFAAARQRSGHPIAISVWDKNSNMKSM